MKTNNKPNKSNKLLVFVLATWGVFGFLLLILGIFLTPRIIQDQTNKKYIARETALGQLTLLADTSTEEI